MNIFAQVNLISGYPFVSSISGSTLSTYQTISGFPKFSSVQIVQLNNLSSSVNEDGNLQIDLTSDDCGILEFEPRNSRFINEQDYYYYGTLKPPSDTCQCTCLDGEIMIVSREGRKFGYIVVDDTKYELLALSESYSVLGKINPEFFASKQECIVSSPTEGQELKVPEIHLEPRTGGCAIRVLFLFTQNAEDAFGVAGINDMANLAISQTNQAFSNSAINNTCVVNANVREWVGFNEDQADFDGDLADLRTSIQVAIWRNTDLADVVILITDVGYNGGILGGVPIQNLGNPQEAFAFGIIEGNSINSNFTFSHELGHVIGGRHQRCETFLNNGCDNTGPFEHGSGWGHRRCWLCSWKNYSTILHQLRDENQRLLYYSNPNVSLKGHPTGIPDSRDNARWIRDGHSCIVAGYNPDPFIPLDAEINGEEILCKPFTGQYYVDVSGTGSPYSYEWHISTDGINWGNVYSTNQLIIVNSQNYPLGKKVFLRVKVSNSLGNIIFRFFEVLILPHTDQRCTFHPQNLVKDGKNSSNVYPNPTSDQINIEFIAEYDNSNVSFTLLNCVGSEISSLKKQYSKGLQHEIINISKLPEGVIILKTAIQGDIKSFKILKLD